MVALLPACDGRKAKDMLRPAKLAQDLTEEPEECLLKSAYASGHSNAASHYRFESEVNTVEGLAGCMQNILDNP